MGELSPQAQAVLDAADSTYDRAGTTRQGIAAALCAVADQIGPDGHDYSHGSIAELMWRGRREARRELLAIAAELDGNNV